MVGRVVGKTAKKTGRAQYIGRILPPPTIKVNTKKELKGLSTNNLSSRGPGKGALGPT